MTESYIEKLTKLGNELEEQLEFERKRSGIIFSSSLTDKINYLNGYIQALSLVKLNKK